MRKLAHRFRSSKLWIFVVRYWWVIVLGIIFMLGLQRGQQAALSLWPSRRQHAHRDQLRGDEYEPILEWNQAVDRIRAWQMRPYLKSNEVLVYQDPSLHPSSDVLVGWERLAESLARAILIDRVLVLPEREVNKDDANRSVMTPGGWTCWLEPIARVRTVGPDMRDAEMITYDALRERVKGLDLHVDIPFMDVYNTEGEALFVLALNRLGAINNSQGPVSALRAAQVFSYFLFRPTGALRKIAQQIESHHQLPHTFLFVHYDDAAPVQNAEREQVNDPGRLRVGRNARHEQVVRHTIRGYMAALNRISLLTGLADIAVLGRSIVPGVLGRHIEDDAASFLANYFNQVDQSIDQQAKKTAEIGSNNKSIVPKHRFHVRTLSIGLAHISQDPAAINLAYLDVLRRHTVLFIGSMFSPFSRVLYELLPVRSAFQMPAFYDIDAQIFTPGVHWVPVRNSWGITERERRARLTRLRQQSIRSAQQLILRNMTTASRHSGAKVMLIAN